MVIWVCAIFTSVFSILSFSPAYSATFEKIEPIAQVYEIQGKATVQSSSDGTITEVKKGCLLGREDSLALDKDASVGLYFKNGGRKEIQAKDSRSLYKVADLLPKSEAYAQTVPLFGATRGLEIPEAGPKPLGFFYPQETIILDSPPLIEFKIFNGSGEVVAPAGATVEILKNSVPLYSQKFNGLEYGSSYVYRCPKLKGGAEYNVGIGIDFQEILGSVVSISFPLYIAEVSDNELMSKYAPFGDSLYRSFESIPADYKGKKHAVSFTKQLDIRGEPRQPVILIEFFITQG